MIRLALTLTWAALALSACAPRYSHLGPMTPEALWTPAPMQLAPVDGVVIAYLDTGAPPGGTELPPLVLVHGLSSTAGFWEHQVEHFRGSRRVIAIDLPGYGASGRQDAPHTPPWYADRIASLLGQLRLGRCDLVGHSMGGQIALTLSHRHPERVRRLVLSAPAGFETFSPGEARFMKAYWTAGRARQATEPEIRRNMLQAAFNSRGETVERLIEERVRLGLHPAFEQTSTAIARGVHGMLDHPVRDLLPQIEVSTLVVFGTHDRLIPNPVFTGGSTRRVAERGVSRMPRATLTMVHGAGHTVHVDAPEAFNRAVDAFLGAR